MRCAPTAGAWGATLPVTLRLGCQHLSAPSGAWVQPWPCNRSSERFTINRRINQRRMNRARCRPRLDHSPLDCPCFVDTVDGYQSCGYRRFESRPPTKKPGAQPGQCRFSASRRGISPIAAFDLGNPHLGLDAGCDQTLRQRPGRALPDSRLIVVAEDDDARCAGRRRPFLKTAR